MVEIALPAVPIVFMSGYTSWLPVFAEKNIESTCRDLVAWKHLSVMPLKVL